MAPIIFNNTEISNLIFNNTNITECWYDGVKVFGGSTPVTPNYFYIECLSDNSGTGGTVQLVHTDEGSYDYYPTLLYSSDKSTWTQLTSNMIITVPYQGKIYFKAGQSGNVGINTVGANGSNKNYFHFETEDFKMAGDISTLLSENGNVTDISNGSLQFAQMCRNEDKLVDISDLIIPFTALGQTTFHYTFNSTNLSNSNCPSMATVTQMDYQSCGNMFSYSGVNGTLDLRNLSTLVNTQGGSNYYCMNDMCNSTNITTFYIGSATPTNNSHRYIFRYTSTLTTVYCGFSDWNGGCNNWLGQPGETGTFYCPSTLGDNETIPRGNYYCPSGWTVINTD